jgi:hypothetical protein
MAKELPLIVAQMACAADRIDRVIRGEDVSVLVFGPTGTGKTQLVLDRCRKLGVTPIFCRNMTKAGFLAFLRKHGTGGKLILIDDGDEFLMDIGFCNLLKQVLVNERRRTITTVNHAALRDGSDSFVIDCRFIMLTNHDPDHVSAKMRPHVQALKGRCPVVSISFDPLELLRYIDYHVCELDYLRRRFRCGLARSQEVLDAYHKYGWRLENIDFRALNSFADEATRYPDRWTETITGILRRKPVRDDEPPPAPHIVPWSMRRTASEVMISDGEPIRADKAAGTPPNSGDSKSADPHQGCSTLIRFPCMPGCDRG